MTNLRDIINAATPGPWSWGVSDSAFCMHAENKPVLSAWAWEEGSTDVDCRYEDATFIATFDPEHVALMEAVIETDDFEPEFYEDDGVPPAIGGCRECKAHKAWRKRQELRTKLVAYRKENGYV